MDVLGRYRNLVVLVGVLFAQVLGLAVQVRRTTDSEPTRLIRLWAVGAVTPLEKALNWVQTSTSGVWHNYFYLRGVRAENRQLKQEIERMRLDQVRISQDADQARRLQALLGFKEQFISQTMAAQVIGSSGSELSRSVYIDKGSRDGLKPDMAVITKDGIVGKVLRVYRSTSLVLLIDDQTSGVGSILDKARLQGILRGTPSGQVVLEKVMSDENVPVGEQVLTSGGDGIFPKGLPVGTVTGVSQGSDLFLNIRVRPAADLGRLEEILVVTKVDERQAQPDQTTPVRAADILAQRLPTVPPKPENAADATGKSSVAPPNGVVKPAPGATSPTAQSTAKPGGQGAAKPAAPSTAVSTAQPAAHSTGDNKPKSASAPGVPAVVPPSTGASKPTTSATRPGTDATKSSAGAAHAPTDAAKTGTPNAVAPKTSTPNTAVPNAGAPVVKKNPAAISPSAAGAVTGISDVAGAAKKPATKPVSTTVTPKPQPAAQDTPQ
jgi:rod shape-determining protein MreC